MTVYTNEDIYNAAAEYAAELAATETLLYGETQAWASPAPAPAPTATEVHRRKAAAAAEAAAKAKAKAEASLVKAKLDYTRRIEGLRRKFRGDLELFGSYSDHKRAMEAARNTAIGNYSRRYIRVDMPLYHNEGGVVPLMDKSWGLYEVRLQRQGGRWVGHMTINRPGNGRTVEVVKNPSNGKLELWGRSEGAADREHRLECQPRFNVADKLEVASTLEPTRRRRVEYISREDRCIIALADAEAADLAAEAGGN